MKQDTGLRLVDMRVDGGMTVNNLLMQMQVLGLGLFVQYLCWLADWHYAKSEPTWTCNLIHNRSAWECNRRSSQADALGMPVLRSKMAEATALGAALAAGLSVGFYHNKERNPMTKHTV